MAEGFDIDKYLNEKTKLSHAEFVDLMHRLQKESNPHNSDHYLIITCLHCFEKEELSCILGEMYMEMADRSYIYGAYDNPTVIKLKSLKRRFDRLMNNSSRDYINWHLIPFDGFNKKKLIWFVNSGYDYFMTRLRKIECGYVNGLLEL